MQTLFRCYFPYVCQCVCLSVCLFPRSEVISQPIFKYDISTDAQSLHLGISENRFEIEVSVKKLFRKNRIMQVLFKLFDGLIHESTCLKHAQGPLYVTLTYIPGGINKNITENVSFHLKII